MKLRVLIYLYMYILSTKRRKEREVIASKHSLFKRKIGRNKNIQRFCSVTSEMLQDVKYFMRYRYIDIGNKLLKRFPGY